MTQREQSNQLCACGCDEFTHLMPQNNALHGWVKGQPFRFRRGHSGRGQSKLRWGEHLWVEEDRGHTTPCFLFQGVADRLGYGRFSSVSRIGSSQLAHRESYIRAHGPIPDGFDIDHLCRQPSCVNPAHLEAVPHKVNVQRGKHAKLNHEIANEIRERRARTGETYQQLAEVYGVEKRTIWRVISGGDWH